MKNSVAANPLGYENVGKLIRQFSIPAIISMVVSALYNMVDQIFIGQGVGILGNAATNIAFPITTICVALSLLLGIGSAANYNLRSGAGREEEGVYYIGNGLVLLISFGIIITLITKIFLKPLLYAFGATPDVFPYAITYTGIIAFGAPFNLLVTGGGHLVRADRSPKVSMLAMLSGAIINTILDPIFIFVCGFGIAGAAWATVIGQAVSGIIVIVYFVRFSKIKIKKQLLKPNGERFKNILALGSAAFTNQICFIAVQIVMNNVLRTYGAMSEYGAEIPIAVLGIVAKVNMIFLSICIGTSQGCQPLFGFNYGARNYDRVKEIFKKASIIVLVSGIIAALMFQLFPRNIISFFGTGSEQYYKFAEKCFRVFMMLTFINGFQPMASGFFSSIGKAKLGMITAITRQALFLIPLMLIFPAFLGVEGVTFAGPIADAAAGLLVLFLARREFKQMSQMKAASQSISE